MPPTSWNLGELFEGVAAAVPDREALIAGSTRLRFAELDQRVDRLAHALVAHGVAPGDRVGLLLRNGAEYLETMLASFKVRAIPVNLHHRYTVEELRYLLADAAPRAVVLEADLADRLEAAVQPLHDGPWALIVGEHYEAELAASPPTPLGVRGRSGDDRYILYTGGTTGMPKGVVWRHHDLLLGALSGANPGGEPPSTPSDVAANAVAGGRTRCLPASPFTHGTAHWTALATILGGGTVVCPPPGPFDPAALLGLAEEERVTLLVIVGDAFARPLADALAEHPTGWDLDSLLTVVSGGAVLSPAVRQALLGLLPGAVVVDGYGTSETGGHGHMAVWPGQPDAGPARFEVGDDTAVLDDDHHPVAPGSGQIGHLARRGHIPLGYHGDAERTARTFPVVEGVRWAVPGDLATVEADGRVILLGRGASCINTGGEKVFPDEVEVTLKAHPAVFDAMVLGVDDDRWGQRVACIVQLRPGSDAGPEDLIEHCREHLAGFKVPRDVVLVHHLERRSTGKPDFTWARHALGRIPAPRGD